MRRLDNKGFTLIELIATLVLLVIVMGIGTFSITKIIVNSKTKDYELLIKNIKDASEIYYQECRYGDADMKNSCYYDFNFDGVLTNKDAFVIQNCISDGFTGNDCEYVSIFGDVDKSGEIDLDDAFHILYNYFEETEDNPIDKSNFFTNLDKLITLGYLTANGKDSDNKNILLNSKTGNVIGNCVIAIEYNNGKLKITSKGSRSGGNESDCPTTEEYNEILGW